MIVRAEEPQQEVVIKIDTKGMAWVYLCLNERVKTEEYAEPKGQPKTHTYYEYDGTQFHAPVDSLDLKISTTILRSMTAMSQPKYRLILSV